MSPIPRGRRILRISAICIAVLGIGISVTVSIQQHILRWRAEHLLADIRAIQMGKSTWTDAQSLMHRWGKWGHYEGSCTGQRCSYQILLEAPTSPMLRAIIATLEEPGTHQWFDLAYHLFGGRYAGVGARFEVIDGVVWGKDYFVMIDVAENTKTGFDGIGLIASADTFWRSERFEGLNSPHPEYTAGRPGACTGCEAVWLRYTPFVNQETINRLMQFNLDCITNWFPCRDEEVMPLVWKQDIAEHGDRGGPIHSVSGPKAGYRVSPEFIGRDKENVVIAEVRSVHPHSSEHPGLDVSFKLINPLKRATSWRTDEVRKIFIDEDLNLTAGEGQNLYCPGQKFILAFRSFFSSEPQDWIDLYPYEPIPLTADSLAAVRRGIRQDIFPVERNIWP